VDFFYKWEALNLSAQHQFSLQAAKDLKDIIKHDMQREQDKRKRAAIANIGPGRGGRGLGASKVLNIGRNVKAEPFNPSAPLQIQQGRVRTRPSRAAAGPSRVAFEGPNMSPEAKRARACMS
jgi:hypothetical protein